ncbi:hypothetical protein DV736_g5341, partial [Chaetothyriales sp. CBS 134916]
MQAELLGIELTIEGLQRDDELSAYNTSWCYGRSNEIVCEVWNKLRCSLDTYYKTLLLTARVNDLERVPDDELHLLKKWYDEESGGADWLRGVEAKVFRDKSCHEDLLSLTRLSNKDDCIATFIATKVLPIYDQIIGHRIHRSMSSQQFRDVREYQFKHLVRLASAIYLILSAALPAASILVLASLHTMSSRLIAIILMALVFSAVMTIVAQKKADVFVAATTFTPAAGTKRKAEDDEDSGSKKVKASDADGAEENGEEDLKDDKNDAEADSADKDDEPAAKTKDASKADESKSSAAEVKATGEEQEA